jgi:hypothetical protein
MGPPSYLTFGKMDPGTLANGDTGHESTREGSLGVGYGYPHSYLSLNDFSFPPSFTGKGKLLGPNFEGVEVYWIAPNS